MPTYEYRCPAGHDFEKFVLKISDAQGTLPCPNCGVDAERQLSAGGGLLFKGSGFYITDYGKDGKKDQRNAPATPASSSASASTTPAVTPAASAPATSAPAASTTPKSGSAE
ncbi:MAG: zinc ribbon domain-containing protein [Gemmatimonadetes bacterium]|nr:zinc ribbon domain-containing protein [Gemmatimonadota bacterium]MBM4190752.1 zinc ribbon domain-containing protein [Gemmatimonadota bacterium]